MKKSFTLSAHFKTSPETLYETWLTGELHTEMTGGEATGTPEEGTAFTAWNDYISGKNLELEAGKRIVQSWRTTEFEMNDADSQIEVSLEPVVGGTQLTLVHTDIPENQTSDYELGWKEHYFEPMTAYFGESSL